MQWVEFDRGDPGSNPYLGLSDLGLVIISQPNTTHNIVVTIKWAKINAHHWTPLNTQNCTNKKMHNTFHKAVNKNTLQYLIDIIFKEPANLQGSLGRRGVQLSQFQPEESDLKWHMPSGRTEGPSKYRLKAPFLFAKKATTCLINTGLVLTSGDSCNRQRKKVDA